MALSRIWVAECREPARVLCDAVLACAQSEEIDRFTASTDPTKKAIGRARAIDSVNTPLSDSADSPAN